MIKVKQEGFVVCIDTLFEGNVIAYKSESTDNEGVMIPTFYPTHVDAWKEIADDLITGLQQFVADERELEHTDFSTEDYVAYAIMYEDDSIKVYLVEDEGKVEFNQILLTTTLAQINE
jgi:hypothetical protein